MRQATWLLIVLAVAACGRNSVGISTPDPAQDAPQASPVPSGAQQIGPGTIGAFVLPSDAPEANSGGRATVLLANYADDLSRLRLNGPVILSAQPAFGNPLLTQDQAKAEWLHIKTWAKPILGSVSAILIDEPYQNGISESRLAWSLALLHSEGFKTLVTEVVKYASVSHGSTDYYGVTCYDNVGPDSRTLDKCTSYYQDHPEWNVVIGQGCDWEQRNGPVSLQIHQWSTIARTSNRPLLFWAWRYPGQECLADNADALAAYKSL